MARIVHFEIPSDDPQASMKFYGDVFGWTFQQFGDNPYWLAFTGSADQPGINGTIMKRNNPQQPLTNAIDVPDIDAAIQSVLAAGGTVVVPKMTIPGVGHSAYFTGPDGNIMGIWQQDTAA